ncbi:MAG: LamG-like jellyroll fold domain-containing protein [Candidatus Brocadiia bacterium]
MRPSCWSLLAAACFALGLLAAGPGLAGEAPAETAALRSLLDAPLLFVQRHSYQGIHIYDTQYKWRPGGGIYVIENPSDPPAEHRVRPVIDPTTPQTLGEGIYSEPELSWDARRILFCFKGQPNGSTSIYEIGLDGTGLRRVTDPRACSEGYRGRFGGVHDLSPAYLPDGRIVFTSTRPHGLVPCFNSGVDILHVMGADGSDIHPISVNNVNEFDPCPLPDGRVLHGRWEYVDKTALTQQSLWTIFPDGTNETALFANNMVHPEALLDARPVPGAPHLVAATFAPHNSPPRGTIGIVDTRRGRDGAQALVNLEHPDRPAFDHGNSCEPWPLSPDVVLFSGRPKGRKRNAIELVHRDGRRETVHAEPDICCHSPMLVEPRPRPPALPLSRQRDERWGRFFVQDIVQGLPGVERGEVAWLRVVEETSRTSPTPGGAFNQTFLMSGVLAWSAKNFLGVVPVAPDGSAYFEVPAGRAIYFQALDAEGRLVQSMRTFVQAAPGVTRSCIGCHEHKYSTPANLADRQALRRPPARPRPESWGSGFIDYPSMVQPILDRHCVRCHGGEEDMAGGLDLTGGWTEYFSISYENLISRRRTQLVAHLIAGIDCMNGTSLWSARLFPPRAHGSGAAPLAALLVEGHEGRIPELSRRERDLLLAWIDTNGLYHGTWDRSPHGCRLAAWPKVRGALVAEMRAAGCTRCHEKGGAMRFESDWFNLQRPRLSRILRAPMARGEGLGLGLCRDRQVDADRRRICILRTGGYVHGVQPLDRFRPRELPPRDEGGEPVASFASTRDPHYQAMLAVIRDGRRQALAAPRVDMPGAEVTAGSFRHLVPPPLPRPLPALEAHVDERGVVHLAWERSARTADFAAEVHRGPEPGFQPGPDTLLGSTSLCAYADASAPEGRRHYALVLCSQGRRSAPIRATALVPPPQPPPAPEGLAARPAPGRVELRWRGTDGPWVRYHVYRREPGGEPRRLTPEPVARLRYSDATGGEGASYAYTVRAVGRRGGESPPAPAVEAAPLPEVKEPVFAASFAGSADASLYGGGSASGRLHGKARVGEDALDLRRGGHVAFAHREDFELSGRFTVACWVRLAKETQMPVVVSCGRWRQAGWFLQRFGAGWRWHAGGIDCDGGEPARGRWTHLVGTYDGATARLFQDGRRVAELAGEALRAPWRGPLLVGQYSGGPRPQYQVVGQIADLRLYRRALPPAEVARAFQAGPPGAER